MKKKYAYSMMLSSVKLAHWGTAAIPVLLLSDFEKAKEKCIKEIDDVIDNVELAMGENNPVDEAYHDACLVMRKIVRKGFGVTK